MYKSILTVVIALLCMAMTSCNGGGGSQGNDTSTSQSEEQSENSSAEWSYGNNGTSAYLVSKNKQHCGYHAEGFLLMMLDHDNAGNKVIFGVVDENGSKIKEYYRFEKSDITRYSHNDSPANTWVTANFSDGVSKRYDALCGSDGSAVSILDPKDVSDFISNLKNSDSCKIMVTFEKDGGIFEFQYAHESFRWNY